MINTSTLERSPSILALTRPPWSQRRQRCETAVEGAWSESPGGEGRNYKDPLPRRIGGTYMDIDDNAARRLEYGSHRGQILREPGQGALEGRRKITTKYAEDPGKGDRLRWRRERPDSNANILRLRPCYVSGYKTIDLRWCGTFGRWRYQLVFEGPGDHRGGDFGGRVRDHVGDRERGTISPSGTGLYHAFPRE